MSGPATEKTGAIVPFVTAATRVESRKDHDELIALFQQRYTALKRFPAASQAMIAELQLRRLARLVDYAARNVPFYAELYRAAGYRKGDIRSFDDFAKLPMISKQQLIDAWSEDRRKNRLLARKQPAAFQACSPRGDGRFVTIVQDRRTIMIETLMAVRQLERQSAGQCGDRDVLLELGSHPWWFSSIGGLYRRVFVSSQSELEDLAGAIRALKPAIVALAPSILGALIDRLGDLRDHQVELVITRGERSSRKERDGWSEALGVRVLDEYSSAELGRIAIECPHRRHHLEEDAVYVEVTKKKSPREPGEIIATSLLNQAMPMIRYRQGELTKFVTGGECPCGSAFRAIESPEGPALDSFTLPHGRIITAAQLMDAVESWRLHLGIPAHGTTFRMVQTAVDRIQLVLRPGPQLSEEMHAPIVEHLEKLIGPGVTVDLVLGEIDDPKVIRFQAESAPAG